MTVLFQGLFVLGLDRIQFAARQQHRFDAMRHRTVRILRRLAFGMVLSVHRHPFLGDGRGGQPQPEPKEMRRNRMQIKGTVRLRAVQEDRDRRNGDVRQDQRVGKHLPPTGVKHTLYKPLHDAIVDRSHG